MDLENNLFQHLRDCRASGQESFESLVRVLMESIAGRPLIQARSGSQQGRDMRTVPGPGTVVHLECKRYKADRSVNVREVLGELQDALIDCPTLDAWILVATTEVPDQPRTRLEKAAHELGITILVIDTSGQPPLLAVLCAARSEIVTEFLGRHLNLAQDQLDRVANVLTSVRSQPEYEKVLSSLVDMLTSEELGLTNWQYEENSWLLRALSEPSTSRAAFFQDLAVQSGGLNIPRTRIYSMLDQWYTDWPNDRRIAVALGEEGDGKSWSLATWAANRLATGKPGPAFLFLPARSIGSVDPIDFISKAIHRHLGQASVPFWERRVRRWVGVAQEETPSIVLVLDGINELASFPWKELLEGLSAEPFRESIAIVLTCRRAFWNRALGERVQAPFLEIEVPPFDDRELEAALAHHTLIKSDFLPQIHELLCRPRYLDLVVKHGQSAGKYDDFTIDRLIVEEWKDRLRRGHPSELSDDDLQALIGELARKSLEGVSSFTPQVVGDHFNWVSDQKQALEDLISHGILERDPLVKGKFKVERNRMVFGLGLVLAEELLKTEDSLPALQEKASSLLEPHSDMDLKGAICGSAVFHALTTCGYPQAARLALMSAWLTNHNQQDAVAQCLPAYFSFAPDAYLDLAEQTWGLMEIDDFSERTLFHTFVDHAAHPRAIEAYVPRFEQWLGLASIDGPERYHPDPEKLAALTNRLSECLGTKPEVGPIDYHGYSIRLTRNEPLLRLGRVALAIISAGSRGPYLHAIATGIVAEALTEDTFKYDLFAWALRMARDDIQENVELEVQRLIDTGELPCLRAAARYLSLASIPELERLRTYFPEDLFPTPDHFRKLEADPLRYQNPWQHENRQFLSMPGLPGIYLAERARELALDPQNQDQNGVRAALRGTLDDLDLGEIWANMSRTLAEHCFDRRANSLAAWAPEVAVDFLRRIARDVVTRSGLSLRQLALHATKVAPILEQSERKLFENVWESLIQRQAFWSDHDRTAELWLFPLLLEGLGWKQQFEMMLRRPRSSIFPISWVPYLSEFPQEAAMSILDLGEVHGRLDFTLDYLSTCRGSLPSELAPRLVALTQIDDQAIRSRAVRLLAMTESHGAIASFVQGPWSFQHCGEGSHEPIWGSRALVRHGHYLSFEELATRLHPSVLGDAIVGRGSKSGELRVLAEVIDRCLGSNGHGDFADIEITMSPEDGLEMAGLPEGWGNRKQRFVSARSHWGGSPPMRAGELGDMFQSITDEDLNRETQRLRDTLCSAWTQKNYLAYRSPGPTPLEALSEAFPLKIDEWIRQAADAQVRRRGLGFFISLSRALFKVGDRRAPRLFRLLWNDSAGFKWEPSGLPMLLCGAFSGEPTLEVERLWDMILDECRADKSLIQATVVARKMKRDAWLEGYIRDRLASPSVEKRARAIACLGLASAESSANLFNSARFPKETWLAEVSKWAVHLSKREEWARYWFRKFLTIQSSVEAWGAWHLFLKTVDSRFWISWKLELESKEVISTRVQQTYRNIGELKKAIEENEESLKETLFGTKIMGGEVWPWLSSGC